MRRDPFPDPRQTERGRGHGVLVARRSLSSPLGVHRAKRAGEVLILCVSRGVPLKRRADLGGENERGERLVRAVALVRSAVAAIFGEPAYGERGR